MKKALFIISIIAGGLVLLEDCMNTIKMLQFVVLIFGDKRTVECSGILQTAEKEVGDCIFDYRN